MTVVTFGVHEPANLLAFGMVDPERQLLLEIADKRMTRDDVALTYAFAIRQANEVDFAKVNAAILDRWSMHALGYIKEGAWRLLREREVQR